MQAIKAASSIEMDENLRKLVDRTSLAVSLEDLQQAKSLGFDAYLAQQLNPNSIDDSVFESKYLDPNSNGYVDTSKFVLEDDSFTCKLAC